MASSPSSGGACARFLTTEFISGSFVPLFDDPPIPLKIFVGLIQALGISRWKFCQLLKLDSIHLASLLHFERHENSRLQRS